MLVRLALCSSRLDSNHTHASGRIAKRDGGDMRENIGGLGCVTQSQRACAGRRRAHTSPLHAAQQPSACRVFRFWFLVQVENWRWTWTCPVMLSWAFCQAECGGCYDAVSKGVVFSLGVRIWRRARNDGGEAVKMCPAHCKQFADWLRRGDEGLDRLMNRSQASWHIAHIHTCRDGA
ncbi:hypothetical protein K458DRAFT_100381 [Lentithecium fluviatile CBS 122367]|uniref:Uncharacterized protein n=1 Tax=Lentithecium fluviatile CBS 122367 TaxID=1168545 RepID=A0A6G1JIC9_9PLEO|nr:hypothetical protein K458DRAFT_100381 [Lentithecium fluviatile CBS 122367]